MLLTYKIFLSVFQLVTRCSSLGTSMLSSWVFVWMPWCTLGHYGLDLYKAMALPTFATSLRSFETQVGQLASTVNNKAQGTFLSDTKTNLMRKGKEHVKAITLRSRKKVETLLISVVDKVISEVFTENQPNDRLVASLVPDFKRHDEDVIECVNLLDGPSCVMRTQFETLEFPSSSSSLSKPSIEEPPKLELKPLSNHLDAYLDAGIIYPISDNERVSSMQCVQKKGGMIVVENENNELILLKIVTGWKVCMDYRKLNKAMRKDLFSLLFIDQMLDKLTGKEFYFFLDGYFGYNQIAIDPEDKENSTITCLYCTFAFKRMPFELCNAPTALQRYIMAIFSNMVEQILEVFMDNFIVFGIVLGHKVSSKGLEVDKAKIETIEKLPLPSSGKGVREWGTFSKNLRYCSIASLKWRFFMFRKLNFDLDAISEKRLSQPNEMDEFQLNAYENAKIYKEKTNRWHDLKIVECHFELGQHVQLFNSSLKFFLGKLKSRWSRPFIVSKVFHMEQCRIITEWKWEKFFEQPEVVCFASQTINQFYNLPNIKSDEYGQYLAINVDLHEVIGLLCNEGTKWKMNKGVLLSFKASAMKKDYKLWMSINVRYLVFNSIVQATRSPHDGLWYPSLITTLCKKVGVIWDKSEEILHPKVLLDIGIMHQLYAREHLAGRGSSSSALCHPP
ncbi:Uncharacterized protein TCM_043710 [Theobroma cacao]|uniref:Reverse transcriptase domain-containing protein n=1 Tax=Theobroma cacao TaxID=3641 RepID=A0A061FQW0_THECC|nr:Uncharacterized protein TCM_043710 [Theobroma cacao]